MQGLEIIVFLADVQQLTYMYLFINLGKGVLGPSEAGAFVGTRGGAGGVGGASTATGAGIAAGGRLADQGADGAICWRSIDGWLLPADAADRLGCSIDGWLLGGAIADVAPGAARKLRSLINATARVQCLNQCVAPASRSQPRWPTSLGEFWARHLLDWPQPHTAVQNRSARPPRRARKNFVQTNMVRGELFDKELLVI